MLALVVATRTPHTVDHGRRFALPLPQPLSAESARLVYIAIALSGLTALGSEVVWTRVLSLLFGATTYTFSLILAVFLVGLGIGSSLGSALARERVEPARSRWDGVQLGAVRRAWRGRRTRPARRCRTGRSIRRSRRRSSFNFQLDLMRAIWVMLPGAILWGASFPLALAAVAAPGQDSARLVGGVYAANTVGAIVGALVDEPGAGRHRRQPDDAAGADRCRGDVGPAHADAGDRREAEAR